MYSYFDNRTWVTPFGLIFVGAILVGIFTPIDHMVAGDAMNHGVRIRLFGMLGAGAIGVFIYCRLQGLSFRRVPGATLRSCIVAHAHSGFVAHTMAALSEQGLLQ